MSFVPSWARPGHPGRNRSQRGRDRRCGGRAPDEPLAGRTASGRCWTIGRRWCARPGTRTSPQPFPSCLRLCAAELPRFRVRCRRADDEPDLNLTFREADLSGGGGGGGGFFRWCSRWVQSVIAAWAGGQCVARGGVGGCPGASVVPVGGLCMSRRLPYSHT